MKNKIFLLTFLIILIFVFNANAANYGGVLKIKVNQRPLNLNPIITNNRTETIIKKQIFDTLFTVNNQGELVSNLAKNWEINKEANLFTINLKEKVYFHPYQQQGKEVIKEERNVTAADWKWSFEYLAASENKSSQAKLLAKVKGYNDYRNDKNDQITGLKVLNRYQLAIELEKADASFIYNLAKEGFVVMPKEVVLNQKKLFSLAPVGTGAFKFKKFDQDQIILEKNNNYWKNNYQSIKLPYLNKIKINFVNNIAESKIDYSENDLYQANFGKRKNEKQMLLNDYYYQQPNFSRENYYYLALNFKSLADKNIDFKNLKLRLQNILKDVNFFVEENPIEKLKFLNRQKENTKFLSKIYQNSKQSNLSDKNLNNSELVLTIAINKSQLSLKLAEIIKNKLKKENIDLKIKKYSWVDFFNNLGNNNDDLFIMTSEYHNKYQFIADNFYSTSNSNFFNYKNRRVDNLIDYLKIEINENSREQAYKILEEILTKDNPFILIFQPIDNYLISSKLSTNLTSEDLLKYPYLYENNIFEALYFK